MVIPAIGAIFYSAKAADSKPLKPTVAECVEKTGFTEEKCTGMITEMKNKKPGEGGMRQGGPGGPSKDGGNKPPMNEDSSDNSSNVIERELEMANRMKTREENRFSRTETRVEKIIEFLNSKDVEDINTDDIKADLETFKNKTDAILNALDTYIGKLEDLQDDDATELSNDVKEAKTNIKDLLDDLRDFYKNTLRVDIKEQLDLLRDEDN